MICGIKEKSIILTYNVFLAIATNILQQIKTGFVLQGHIYTHTYIYEEFICKKQITQVFFCFYMLSCFYCVLSLVSCFFVVIF